MKLKDKVVLITGGSGGIGKAVAELFFSEGARVAITARNKKKLSKTSNEIGAFAVSGDIRKYDQVREVVEKTVKKFGQIDILVNNAGIYPNPTPLYKVEEQDWNKVIDVNLTGTFRYTKAVLPHMISNNFGCIINVSSNAGLRPSEDIGADSYAASKAAIVFLTKMWAIEFAKNNIRVNCVCPGVVDTEMSHSFMVSKEERRKISKEHPLGRIGTPEEIAKAILYLASEDSSWVTGSILAIDGGVSAK